MEESEQIVIVYNYWTEFADEEEDVYPDDELSTCSVSAARVDKTHFRITWYTSLAITGPWGPTLNLGDIIQVRPLSDGTYRYLGTSEKNDRIGNITWPVRMEIFDRDDLLSLLSKFVDVGACWEGASGNLTIQAPMVERPELQVIVTGDSVDKAIENALETLKKDKSDVVVDVINDGRTSQAKVRVVPLDSPEEIRSLITQVYAFLNDHGLFKR